MAQLRVRLLGGLVVEGMRPADIGSRKARRLLAALAVRPRRPVAVDQLAEVVWGDEPPARPGEQVGVLVSRLRAVLGADHLVRHDAGYQLVGHWVDVEELESGTATAQALLRAGDGIQARLAAAMALDLARGPLLPELDGDWFEGPRAAVERTVAMAGLVAAEAALLVGDGLGATAAASRALDHDPYDEAALRALMRAHAATGRPASALQAYAAARIRLRDDLGVAPDATTEALHDELLGVEPSTAGGAPSPPSSDRAGGTAVASSAPPPAGSDPLVQRARVELASNDLVAARRDAEAAARRSGSAAALELAGWAAYYARDLPGALRWAEQVAASSDPERRASSLALAGRVHHSTGHLATAEAELTEAGTSTVAGVRAMADIWLATIRAHQGRPGEAVELARRGGVDEAAIRHPFAIPHSHWVQVYGLAQAGRVVEALAQLDAWDQAMDDIGPAGERYRPAALNFRGWVLAAIGHRAEAEVLHRDAVAMANTLQEPRVHGQLDLARCALDAGDTDEAARRLVVVVIPADGDGTMVWHQRHRYELHRAQLALAIGDAEAALAGARAVETDAAARGASRAARLARAVELEARFRLDDPPAEAEVRGALDALAPAAALERWRVAAHLGAASGWGGVREQAGRWAEDLARASGPHEAHVRAWTAAELRRIGLVR